MDLVTVTNDFATRKFLHYPPDEGFAQRKKGKTPAKNCLAWRKIVRYPPDDDFAWRREGKTPAENCLAWRKIVRYPSDEGLARRLFLDRHYRHAIVCLESTRRQSLGRCAKRTLKTKRFVYSCARRLTAWFLSFYCPITSLFVFFISLFHIFSPPLKTESDFFIYSHPVKH